MKSLLPPLFGILIRCRINDAPDHDEYGAILPCEMIHNADDYLELTLWKKGENFDAEKLKSQAA